MAWTRREFLVAMGTLTGAAAAGAPIVGSPVNGYPYDDPAYLIGDPYRSTVEEPGLTGRSFGQARDRAMRWRVPPPYRDREVLGIDLSHA